MESTKVDRTIPLQGTVENQKLDLMGIDLATEYIVTDEKFFDMLTYLYKQAKMAGFILEVKPNSAGELIMEIVSIEMGSFDR